MLNGLSLSVVIENHRKWTCGEKEGARADLGDADLRDSNLSGANLRGANMRGANMRGVDLRGADLRGADLSGVDLSDANMRDADLSDANMRGVPFINNIHQAVYAAASQEGALDMGSWHGSCGTTHCRAGWIISLAGDAGRAMEWCLGTPAAAALIYLRSDPKLECVPDFYACNETALADMKQLAEAERLIPREGK